MIRDRLLSQTNSTATETAGGPAAGPMNKPGGAPQLPDVVPDGVQKLLDGIFGFTGDMGRAFGDMVSGLANSIQGGGGQQAMALVIDAAGVLL